MKIKNIQKNMTKLRRSVISGISFYIALLVLAVFAGCSTNNPADKQFQTRRLPNSPALILNNSQYHEGNSPEFFTARTNWPATETYTKRHRFTVYEKRWYDRVSLRPGHHSYSYRLFRSKKTGITEK